MFTDASCYHAAFGTLLLNLTPTSNPASVLGRWSGTSSVLENDTIRFEPVLPALVRTLRAAGYTVDGAPAREDGLAQLTMALERAGSAVVVLDTYFLHHFWVDRGKKHALHSVVLRDFDLEARSVRLTDPGDVITFDGRVPLDTLAPALVGEDLGQGWMVLEEHVTQDRLPPASWAQFRQDLAGIGGRALSGLELTQALCERLTALFANDTQPDDDPGLEVPALQHGLWTYHHTMRWFGEFLRSEHGVSPTSALVDRAAQDLLVVRALLRHAGVDEQDRTTRHRTEIKRRLDRIAQSLETVAAELPSDSSCTHPQNVRQVDQRA